jgi:demethylmenaquinone methyltransferase/2-methoxy-6-polyprenyl-1,4-benzoquinol methylase
MTAKTTSNPQGSAAVGPLQGELAAKVGYTASFTPDPKAITPEAKHEYVHGVFENIAAGYDKMNDVESFGLHRLWKKALLREVAAVAPERVLDVATGTGDIALSLAAELPEAHIVGFDFSEAMLAVARRRAVEQQLDCLNKSGNDDEVKSVNKVGDDNSPFEGGARRAGVVSGGNKGAGGSPHLEFVQGDAMKLPYEDGSFDVATISFGLRNMPDYGAVVREMVRVLRPGGKFCCLDASYPTNWFVKPFFRLYFKHIMPAMANLVAGNRAAYQWLNDSTEAFLTKPALLELMGRCGLTHPRYRSFLLGSAALHVGVKP